MNFNMSLRVSFIRCNWSRRRETVRWPKSPNCKIKTRSLSSWKWWRRRKSIINKTLWSSLTRWRRTWIHHKTKWTSSRRSFLCMRKIRPKKSWHHSRGRSSPLCSCLRTTPSEQKCIITSPTPCEWLVILEWNERRPYYKIRKRWTENE